MNATTALQIITNVEDQDEAGYTRGWIVPAGTATDADLEVEAIDHVDIPATENEADWIAGFLDAVNAEGWSVPMGTIARDGGIVTATVIRA